MHEKINAFAKTIAFALCFVEGVEEFANHVVQDGEVVGQRRRGRSRGVDGSVRNRNGNVRVHARLDARALGKVPHSQKNVKNLIEGVVMAVNVSAVKVWPTRRQRQR